MNKCVNLLPWRTQCAMLLRRRMWQWSAGGAIACVLLCIAYASYWRKLADARKDLESWQRRATAVLSVDQKNQTLLQKINSIKSEFSKYGHLESEALGYNLIAAVSHCSSNCGGKIQITNLSFRVLQIPEPIASATAAKGATKSTVMRETRALSLAGVGASNVAIARFVSSLRDLGVFGVVDLKSTHGMSVTMPDARSFRVECKL